MSEPVLRTDNLTREVGGRRIVDCVNIEVSEGELVAIIGPSGSGKTSLSRLLNRLDEPTSGTVYVNGADYREMPPRELRRQVGMVMQRAFLFPGTVAANVRFGPEQRGEHVDDKTVSTLLERVGLPGFATRTIEHLSGGEGQRVSLARTLANRPSVLLMDEPTSGLDETLKRQIETLVVDVIRERRLACVLVTHDVAQASRVSERVVRLEQGRVTAFGAAAEVLHVEPAH